MPNKKKRRKQHYKDLLEYGIKSQRKTELLYSGQVAVPQLSYTVQWQIPEALAYCSIDTVCTVHNSERNLKARIVISEAFWKI